ncbi:MAG: VanZ family protein [Desulfuromonadales bacterium]|nr:VanZ family protein [Desulfuromonadales bacterium]
MTGRLRFKIYLLLLIIFTAVLVVLSLRSFSSSVQLFSNQDKVGHFFAYAVTAWLACQALRLRLKRRSTLIFSFLYASVIGAVLEILQLTLTTSRRGEWSDLLANLLGALTGCVIFSLIERLKFKHESDETD